MKRLAVVLFAAGVLFACKRAETNGVELQVFAAASLRESFEALKPELAKDHPNVTVVFHFAGSQELRTQIEHGAPADVLATADTKHMAALEEAKQVDASRLFARNEPVVVVPRGSTIRSFSDLPNAPKIVLGLPEVPIGRYTVRILEKAGADFKARVEAKVVSREANVKQVLAKVTLGEADAAIVYRTDTRPVADEVEVVTIPPETNVIAEYPIAVVAGAKQADAARAWVELVTSPAGQKVLQEHGFLPVMSASK
jgi:molybdate transport system substrate-binding protein